MNLRTPISYYNEDEQYLLNLRRGNFQRGVLTFASLADLHFGSSMDPAYQYKLLREQFINRLYNSKVDVVVIAGDIFHNKLNTTSDALLYANKTISDILECSRYMGFTTLILEGTFSHDNGQLKLFYHYLTDPTIDLRIVEKTKFEYIKGAKVLCIPEEYGMSKEYYNNFFKEVYDIAIMHGMIKGAIPVIENQHSSMHSMKSPIFTIEDFRNCKTCIISGHIHTPGCFSTYFYYCGSPYTWQFGEDVDKGFLVTLINLDNLSHYTHFEIIESDRLVTVNMDKLLSDDPRLIVEEIKKIQSEANIGKIRIEFLKEPTEAEIATLELVKSYFKTNNKVKIKYEKKKDKVQEEANNLLQEKFNEYSFIMDKTLSKEQIFVMYVNKRKGYEYITVEELMQLLKEE